MSSAATASRPAGSRRFWLTVLCFAIANLAIWLVYARLAHPRRSLLEIRQSAPADKSLVTGRPTFWWTFNLDVAQPGPNDPPPGVVSPAVPGNWTWDNPHTLTFTPDRPLAKATNLKVTLLPQRLRTPDGFSLSGPFATVVHTAGLGIQAIRQAAFDERDRAVIEIQLDDDVLPSDVLQHLSLTSAENKPVTFHLYGEASGNIVRVLTDPIPTKTADHSPSFIRVRLSAGLAGRSGPIGLTRDDMRVLPIGSDLVATDVSSSLQEHDCVLIVRFNNTVDPQVVRQLLSVEPVLPFTLTGGGNEVELHGAFEPATRYAIRIAKPLPGLPPLSCPRPDTLSVYVPDRTPAVWFEHDEGYLGSAGNRTILAHAVNVTDVRASVTRVYDNNLISWRNSRGKSSWGAESYARPVATRNIRLPALKNKTQDVRLSLDELLPAGTPHDGVYLLTLDSVVAAQSDSEGDEPRTMRHRYWGSDRSAMVTLSDIALTAKRGRSAVTVWATSLRTAEPLAHVRVRLYSNKNQPFGEATTNDDGLAKLALLSVAPGEEPTLILADRPDAQPDTVPASGRASTARDLTWLDLTASRISFGQTDTGGASYLRSGQEAFIYTDRGVYRPGETVHLRAIVRDAQGAPPSSFPVRWQFRRPDLHNWKAIDGLIDSDGAVLLDLPLPSDLPTGRWSVLLGLAGHVTEGKAFGSASFQVEEFMPNRMQVALSLAGDKVKQPAPKLSTALPRFMVNQVPLTARVQADYLFGKAVSGRPARLIARLDPSVFAPPQWSGWTFGDAAGTAEMLDDLRVTGHRTELPQQTLDDTGHASFELELESLLRDEDATGRSPLQSHSARHTRKYRGPDAVAADPPPPGTRPSAAYVGPWHLTVTASVIETGGRAVSASRQAELDPVPWYIAIRSPAAGLRPDVSSAFAVALVAPDGQQAPTDAELEAGLYREVWNNSLTYEGGRYVYHSTRLLEPVRNNIKVKVMRGTGQCQVTPTEPGAYVLRLRDPQTASLTSIGLYVGAGAWEDNISREDPERLELLVQRPAPTEALVRSIARAGVLGMFSAARAALASSTEASNAKFRPGEPAQVIVRSPFAGQLLLSLETDDVVSTRVIDMPDSHVAVPIEITGAMSPNAYVTATVIRPIDPDAQWQTHRATGMLRVPIDNSDRKLNVQIDSPNEMRPANSLAVALHVTDSSGAPVKNAAVTVAAVDEGICQLTGFTTPDPFAFFTRKRALGVVTADLYSQLMPEVPRPDKTSPIGGDRGAYDPRHASPVPAKRVKPVAIMSGVLHTDADGSARADLNVPQFSGKLRIMAIASADRFFGSAEGAVLVRSPLLVQSSWPRFAAPGDKFLVPLVVINNTRTEGRATVTLRIVDGPLHLGDARDLNLPPVTLGPNGQSTQFIEVTVANHCGVSHVMLSAEMGDETYEEDVELPVRPASPEVTIGGYAVATPKKATEISLPGGMLDGTAHFQLKATPRPSLQLPRALDYLERYPYGCLEQTTSALFPLVYLSDIGRQIAPGLFEKQRVAEKVQAGITRLIGMQTADGGLAMWPAYREAWPWGSVYAAHFLVEAQAAGHHVPDEFRDQLLGYLRRLLNQGSDNPEVLETQAYACYVLALAGKPERPVMSRLSEMVRAPRSDGVQYAGQARFHLAAAWLAAGRRDLAEELIPQALPAPRDKRSLAGSLGSPVRDRAILLDTLLAVQPDHPALPQLAQQLADAGQRGQWCSTQDTAFAVLALGRYLRQSKSDTPYDTAELILDGMRLARAEHSNPLLWDAGTSGAAIPAEGSKLQLRVTGPARSQAHVAWLETGVPLKPPPPADHGVKVRRRFLDERAQPLNITGVHSGDLIQVELTISSDTPLQHIVIDDLLPAGLEIENPRFKTTTADTTERRQDGQQPNAFTDARLEMRDDRLVLMGSLIAAGSGAYVYTARAVTPGTFILPPVRAECMYDNATNSLSGAGTFRVLPAGAPNIANVQE